MNNKSFLTRACTNLALAMILIFSSLAAQADVLSDALERGNLRVGVSLFTPWTMKKDNGELIGFEIDVSKKLALDMGLEVEYKVYAWEDIIPALQKGEIDLVSAGMGITPGRALQVNFSLPYDDWGATLVTNTERTSEIQSLAELNQPDIVMATVSETFAHQAAGHLFDQVNLKLYREADEAEQAVLDGTVHVYLVSSPEAYHLALANPGVVDLPLAEPLVETRAAFAVKKGEQEWLNFLNAWIIARDADMWIDTSHRYWFRSIEWRKDHAQEAAAE